MATQGRWLGDWPGAWWGSSDSSDPGSLSGHASISISASGNLQTIGSPVPELPFPGYGTFIPPKRRRVVEEDEALLLMELI
jgi:hypothetical protein